MRARLAAIAALSCAVLLTLGGSTISGRASTPSSGTLDTVGQQLTWTNPATLTGMAGSAASKRNQTCAANPTACDDFTLTLSTAGDPLANIVVAVTPTSGAVMTVLLYAPGCSSAVTDTSACYSVEGTHFTLIAPADGSYLLRVACTACPAQSGYSASATYTDTPPQLPGLGNQTYSWASQELPGSTGTAAGEPGISVNPSGHVIVNTFGPTVWISKDDGGHWSSPNSSIDPSGCPSGDADAVVSFDNAYYADNLCTAGPTNLSFTSRDDGATWNPDRSGLPSPNSIDSDRQWYAVDPVNPGVVYFNWHDLAGPNIWIIKSTDYGSTWGAPVPVSATADNFVDSSQGNTAARALVDPTNPQRVLVFYTSNLAQNSATAPPTNQDFDLRQINLAESLDGGQTFTNHLVSDFGQTAGLDNTIAHEFSSATLDSQGNAYLAVSLRLGNATQTHIVAAELAKGRSVLSPSDWHQVDQGGLGANVFPSITAGDPGRIDVTWYGSTAQDNNDTSSQWSEMFAQSLNFGVLLPPEDPTPTNTFVQSNISGATPTHGADICLAGTLCLVTGGNRNLSDFQSVATDPCGGALVVYDNDAKGGGDTTFAKQTAGASLFFAPPAGCTLGTVPTAGTPEAPSPSILLIIPLVAAAGLYARHRRRGPATA
jgi:hypothetical protein